jgi:hypothetical protein
MNSIAGLQCSEAKEGEETSVPANHYADCAAFPNLIYFGRFSPSAV